MFFFVTFDRQWWKYGTFTHFLLSIVGQKIKHRYRQQNVFISSHAGCEDSNHCRFTEAAFEPACNTQESTLLLKKIEKWNQYINEMYTCNIFKVKLTPSRWWFYSEGNKLYLAKTFHWDWFATKYMYENNPNQRVGSALNIS